MIQEKDAETLENVNREGCKVAKNRRGDLKREREIELHNKAMERET